MTPPDATQGEEAREQLARVEMMASGDPTWDLSDNDRAALEALLERVARAERAAEEGWSLFYEYADDPQAILSARAKEATP